MLPGIAKSFYMAGMAGVLFFSTPAFSFSASSKIPVAVTEGLQKKVPLLTVDSIEPSEIGHLYRVVSGPSVFYVSEDGRYLLQGDIFDLQKELKNVTQIERRRALLTSINELESKGFSVIWYKAPKEKRVLTVFTDLDCGYCRRFHQDIPLLNARGVSVRYLAFPRGGIESDTYQKTQSVWCASDPATQLTRAKNGDSVASADCASKDSVKAEYQLGVMAGVQGTPTLVTPDGEIIPGYVKPERLLSILGIK